MTIATGFGAQACSAIPAGTAKRRMLIGELKSVGRSCDVAVNFCALSVLRSPSAGHGESGSYSYPPGLDSGWERSDGFSCCASSSSALGRTRLNIREKIPVTGFLAKPLTWRLSPPILDKSFEGILIDVPPASRRDRNW